jgi:excisionase family DNA binding protein
MQHVPTFLTPADAARVLGVTPATIRLMVQRGDLRVAAMTESGIRLFERAEVERLASLRSAQVAERRRRGKDGSGDDAQRPR